MRVIVASFIIVLVLIACDISTPKERDIYYNVPTFTTIYEIVYPDTIWRKEVKSHSRLVVQSSRGSNHIGTTITYRGNKPPYWQDEWFKTEPREESTAPIRIVRQTVEFKKTKYTYR